MLFAVSLEGFHISFAADKTFRNALEFALDRGGNEPLGQFGFFDAGEQHFQSFSLELFLLFVFQFFFRAVLDVSHHFFDGFGFDLFCERFVRFDRSFALDFMDLELVVQFLALQSSFAPVCGKFDCDFRFDADFFAFQSSDDAGELFRFIQPDPGVIRLDSALEGCGGIVSKSKIAFIGDLHHVAFLSSAGNIGVVGVETFQVFEAGGNALFNAVQFCHFISKCLVVRQFDFGSGFHLDGEGVFLAVFGLHSGVEAAERNDIEFIIFFISGKLFKGDAPQISFHIFKNVVCITLCHEFQRSLTHAEAGDMSLLLGNFCSLLECGAYGLSSDLKFNFLLAGCDFIDGESDVVLFRHFVFLFLLC